MKDSGHVPHDNWHGEFYYPLSKGSFLACLGFHEVAESSTPHD